MAGMAHEARAEELQGHSLLCGPALSLQESGEAGTGLPGTSPGPNTVLSACPSPTLVPDVWLGGAQTTLGRPLLSAPCDLSWPLPGSPCHLWV